METHTEPFSAGNSFCVASQITFFLLYIRTASSRCPNIPLTDSQEPLLRRASLLRTWLPLAFGNHSDICSRDWSRGPAYPGACREVTSRTADTSSTPTGAPRGLKEMPANVSGPCLTHRGFTTLSRRCSKWVIMCLTCHVRRTQY